MSDRRPTSAAATPTAQPTGGDRRGRAGRADDRRSRRGRRRRGGRRPGGVCGAGRGAHRSPPGRAGAEGRGAAQHDPGHAALHVLHDGGAAGGGRRDDDRGAAGGAVRPDRGGGGVRRPGAPASGRGGIGRGLQQLPAHVGAAGRGGGRAGRLRAGGRPIVRANCCRFLEQGGVVVYYDPARLPQADAETLRGFVQVRSNSGWDLLTLVALDDSLPSPIVATAWRHAAVDRDAGRGRAGAPDRVRRPRIRGALPALRARANAAGGRRVVGGGGEDRT